MKKIMKVLVVVCFMLVLTNSNMVYASSNVIEVKYKNEEKNVVETLTPSEDGLIHCNWNKIEEIKNNWFEKKEVFIEGKEIPVNFRMAFVNDYNYEGYNKIEFFVTIDEVKNYVLQTMTLEFFVEVK